MWVFTSLILSGFWVWCFFGGKGPCSSCGALVRGAPRRRVSHRESVSAPSPVFVPPSAVNGGGRDPYQAPHQKAHETKSGVSRVSVRACARGRRGGRRRMTTHNTHSPCASFCQEVRSHDESHAHIILAYEVWRMVRGGNSQWSDCDSRCDARERICECLQPRECELCKNWVRERQH